jgi:hypothetical protein
MAKRSNTANTANQSAVEVASIVTDSGPFKDLGYGFVQLGKSIYTVVEEQNPNRVEAKLAKVAMIHRETGQINAIDDGGGIVVTVFETYPPTNEGREACERRADHLNRVHCLGIYNPRHKASVAKVEATTSAKVETTTKAKPTTTSAKVESTIDANDEKNRDAIRLAKLSALVYGSPSVEKLARLNTANLNAVVGVIGRNPFKDLKGLTGSDRVETVMGMVKEHRAKVGGAVIARRLTEATNFLKLVGAVKEETPQVEATTSAKVETTTKAKKGAKRTVEVVEPVKGKNRTKILGK